MKKIILALVAVFAFTSIAAFANEEGTAAPAEKTTAKAKKKVKKDEKKDEHGEHHEGEAH